MLEMFLEEAGRLSKDVEFASEFYRDLVMRFELEDEGLENNHKNILELERQGKTGFDCGWVHVVLGLGEGNNSVKKLIEEIKNNKGLKEQWKTLVYAREVRTYGDGGLQKYGFQFNFENYGLNVQSTRLKHEMHEYFMNELVKKFKVLENQYYINRVLD